MLHWHRKYSLRYNTTKMTANGWLSASDRQRNQDISSDRMIVEKYFGRLCSSNVIGGKWKWEGDVYDFVFMFAEALTNVHIMQNPLCDDDGVKYSCYNNEMMFIGEQSKKRAHTRREYRKRRCARLSAVIEPPVDVSTDDDADDDNNVSYLISKEYSFLCIKSLYLI